jgi:hypothetical protein
LFVFAYSRFIIYRSMKMVVLYHVRCLRNGNEQWMDAKGVMASMNLWM